MRAPWWARRVLERLAAPDRVDEVVGDLEEAYRERVGRRGRLVADVLTLAETLDMAGMLIRDRRRRRGRVSSVGAQGGRLASSVGVSWLDVRLGARLLARYPVVTVVGGVALAIGIGLSAAYLEIARDFLRPSLPLDDGDRIVGIQTWDLAAREVEQRTLHDFVTWRGGLATVGELSAYRSVDRNVGAAEGGAEPAYGAEMSPSGFRVARVPALLGRTLTDEDEQEGAPAVVVLGYDLWRSRFGGDAGILGRAVRVGRSLSTVVGVMPEGFSFPVSHEFWVPLRVGAEAYGPRQGPPVRVFGRLAEGASLEAARSELAVLGLRAAEDLPASHEHLRPRVVRYVRLFVGGSGSGVAYGVQFLFVVLLLVLASNVATLIFARTATRESEIAMRFALGASRGRILVQMFAEALVLALLAAAVALVAVRVGTARVAGVFWQVAQRETPFWVDERLGVTTILFGLGLAVLAAVVAGVLPALRATRTRLQARLRHAAGAGGSGGSAMRFGGAWSAVIAVQVALAVLVLPPAIVAVAALGEAQRADAGFHTDQYLSARVELDPEVHPTDSVARAEALATFQARVDGLRRRLAEEPRVSRIAVATRLPGMDHPTPYVEVDTVPGTPAAAPKWVMTTAVEPGYFEAFGAKIVAGRGFRDADAEADLPVVVVNETFVGKILDGRNAVGRRVRYAGGSGAGLEIVGVVSDIGMDTDKDAFHPGTGAGVYYPLTGAHVLAGGTHSLRMAFHVRGDPSSFAPRLREIAGSVDPALRLYDVLPLDRPVDHGNRNQRLLARLFTWTTALVGVIAILISVAGTYSVLSFTVSRRTREIGIRIALGADRRRIVRSVFSQAMLQIGAGIALGTAAWFYVMVYVLGGADELWLLASTAGVLCLVGTAACLVPVRRVLRIEPTEALREIG